MSIMDKYHSILNYSIIPVVCDKCDYADEVNRPTDYETLSALIDASYLHAFQAELEPPNARKSKRGQFIAGLIEQHEQKLDRLRIQCPHCQSSHIRIEAGYFYELGWSL